MQEVGTKMTPFQEQLWQRTIALQEQAAVVRRERFIAEAEARAADIELRDLERLLDMAEDFEDPELVPYVCG